MKYHSIARVAFVLGLLGCILAVPGATNAETRAQDAGIQSVSCQINLSTNSHNCPASTAILFTSGPSSGRTVVRLRLDPAITGYRRAAFDVHYSGIPNGWTVNIGDSISNNGGGGDSYNQSNDSEVQIYGTTLTLYGNQATNSAVIYTINGAASEGSTTRLEVLNQQLNWFHPSNPGGIGIGSSYIFALAGQPDTGSVNYDIYAAFNQTVQYVPGRLGSGVTSVGLTLYPY